MLSIVKTLSILTLAAGLAVLCIPNNLPAREWSEPIRLTNHEEEWMNTYFDVEIDGEGFIHLLYKLQMMDREPDNNRIVYLKCNSDGEAVVGPLCVLPDTTIFSYPRMCLDDNDNVQIVAYNYNGGNGDREYYHASLDGNGDYITESHIIDGMNDPWFFRRLVLYADGSGPTLRSTHDGNLVYACRAWEENPEDQYGFTNICYIRLTPEGELIDSAFVVNTFTNSDHDRGNPYYMDFETDSHGNLYFVYTLLHHGSDREPWLAKVNAEDSIIVSELSLPFYEEGSTVMVNHNLEIDENENVYTYLWEAHGNSGIMHVQKINSELEIVFDRFIVNRESGRFNCDLSLNGDQLGVFTMGELNDEDRSQASFMSIDSLGETVDTLQFLGYQLGSWLKASFYDDDFYYFFSRYLQSGTAYIYMSKQFQQEGACLTELHNVACPLSISNFPDPFNSETTICVNFNSPTSSVIRLYDSMGRVLFSNRVSLKYPGEYRILWSDMFNGIMQPPAGIYFLEVSIPEENRRTVKSLHLLK